MGPGDADGIVEADKVPFGTAFIGALGGDDGLVHRCMAVGQHYNDSRRIRTRCAREHRWAIVCPYLTCLACITYVQEKRLPL